MAAKMTTELDFNAFIDSVMLENLFLEVLHFKIRPQLTEIAIG